MNTLVAGFATSHGGRCESGSVITRKEALEILVKIACDEGNAIGDRVYAT